MEVTAEQWERIKDLFEGSLECAPEHRTAFLERECTDSFLRGHVETLLKEYENAGNFLESGVLAEIGSASASFLPGKVLASRFQVIRLIARGGMGEVYEAEDLELHENVAIKRIRPDIVRDNRSLDRFKREVSLAKRVTHPNVCRTFDLFRHSENGTASEESPRDIFFVSMELLRGETLAERLNREGLLKVDEAYSVAVQIASGLTAAHQLGILHRDLKPGNVILVSTADGKVARAVITDFGLACVPGSLGIATGGVGTTTVSSDLGTPAYMAPEQLHGGRINVATDIYALGLVLFELITGKRAFEGNAGDTTSTSTRDSTNVSTKLRELSPDCNSAWQRVVEGCLANRPEDRFGSAEEVVQALAPNIARPGIPSLLQHVAKRWQWMLGVTAILVGAAVSIPYLQHRPVLTQHEPLLLADFENYTGQPVFDGALKQALAVQLGQSPFLNILPQERVQQTLRYMGRPADTLVLLPLAREVCERLDAKALLAGSIAPVGTHYSISLDVVNCLNGNSLVHQQTEADSKDHVLRSLDETVAKLRRTLGESLGSIQRFDVPIQQATTASLEALKAYALAREYRSRGMESDSIPLFKHAIEIDPSFAMAYAQLATAYDNLGETDEAAQYLKKAVSLVDRVSARERFFSLSRYYNIATGQLDKSIETAQEWAQTYPDDWLPYDWLAARYLVIGKYEKAVEAAREAMRLGPNFYTPYANLSWAYRSLNRFSEAKVICEKAIALKRDSSYIHKDLYAIAFLQGDQAAMQRQLDWARGPNEEEDLLDSQASVALASGKRHAARELSHRVQAASLKHGFRDDAAFSMAWEALNEADIGNYLQSRSVAKEVLQIARGVDARETAAEALALAGELRKARELVDELQRRFPQHTVLNSASLPTIRATIEMQSGNPARAVELLRQAEPYDYSEFASLAPVYVRGLAYLRSKRGKEAAGEFQKLLDHPGIAILSPRRSLARLGLARSYALVGDNARSREAYEAFLSSWKDADSDIPILKEAKREFSKLQ
jgi:serine/threonine protein kinase/tetratricopeptide (TPR) repeat protein